VKRYPSRQSTKQRRTAAATRALLFVAILASLAYLPLYVLAQRVLAQPALAHQQTNAPQTSAARIDKSGASSEVFVIYRDDKGESVCRKATAVEKARLLERHSAGPANTIYAGGRLAGESGKSPLTTASGTQLLPSAGLRIVLHATSQLQNNPAARDAFIVAANRWEALVSTPITVVLDVDFGSTFFGQPWGNPNILGATGTANVNMPLTEVRTRLINNVPGPEELDLYNALPTNSLPVELNGSTTSASNIRTTLAVGRAIGFVPNIDNPDAIPSGQGDAIIGFNSAHAFDFDPDNGISAGTLDFDAVVVHEIGHALGFTSRSGDGVSSPLSMWDIFRFRPGVASLATVGTAPRVMSEGGAQIFFNNRANSFGTAELQLSTGGSDGVGGDNAQSSHWKDDRLTAFIGIMDPTLPSGRRQTITANDLSALDTFGYKIGGTAPPPPSPPPAPVNDNFSVAIGLSATSGSITGTNIGATGEIGELSPWPNSWGRKSVWYNWTPLASSSVVFNTSGSNFDTVLSVYVGNAVNSLSLVTFNDDVQNGILTHSSVSFSAQRGTTYRIVVDGFEGDSGNVTLNWIVPNAPNIRGRITNQDGSPVGGLQVYLSGSEYAAVTTNSNGDYAFNNLNPGGTYYVTPDRDGGPIGFVGSAPAFSQFEYVTADQTANFVRIFFPAFHVSGRVTNENGDPMPHISIAVPGATAPFGGYHIPDEFTDANGNYSFLLGAGSNYELTPTTFGFPNQPPLAYTPAVVSITNLSADQTANFTTSRRIFNVSGRVLEHGAGLGGVNVSLQLGLTGTTRTTTTGSDGIYRFLDVPFVSFYNLGVEKPGYMFNPAGLSLSSVFQNPSDIEATKLSEIVSSEPFVRQHYLDFLNRPGDASGVQFWTHNIDNCGSNAACREGKRVDTSAAFFLSIEFQETGYLVYRFYKSAYGNIPGAPVPIRFAEFLPDTQQIGQNVQVGIGAWQAQLEANKQAFALDFVARPRFTSAFATTLTPAQFVDQLFVNSGAPPATSERNAAIAEFGSATNTADANARARVLRLVAENGQLKNIEFRKAFVLMQYFGYLRRNPDDAPELTRDYAGFNFWLNKLNEFNGNYGNADMVKAFILSGEYLGRF
jgi:hypothetical protein